MGSRREMTLCLEAYLEVLVPRAIMAVTALYHLQLPWRWECSLKGCHLKRVGEWGAAKTPQ